MTEPLTERQKILLEADDRVQEAKPYLAERFKKAAMPVESISTLLSSDFPDPGIGIGVELSRLPTAEETPQLPKRYDGIPVKYVMRKDGKTLTVTW